MTRDNLLVALRALIEPSQRDPEAHHSTADSLLTEYINDPEITQAYEAIDKYYA